MQYMLMIRTNKPLSGNQLADLYLEISPRVAGKGIWLENIRAEMTGITDRVADNENQESDSHSKRADSA